MNPCLAVCRCKKGLVRSICELLWESLCVPVYSHPWYIVVWSHADVSNVGYRYCETVLSVTCGRVEWKVVCICWLNTVHCWLSIWLYCGSACCYIFLSEILTSTKTAGNKRQVLCISIQKHVLKSLWVWADKNIVEAGDTSVHCSSSIDIYIVWTNTTRLLDRYSHKSESSRNCTWPPSCHIWSGNSGNGKSIYDWVCKGFGCNVNRSLWNISASVDVVCVVWAVQRSHGWDVCTGAVSLQCYWSLVSSICVWHGPACVNIVAQWCVLCISEPLIFLTELVCRHVHQVV